LENSAVAHVVTNQYAIRVLESLQGAESGLSDVPSLDGMGRDLMLTVVDELLQRGWVSAAGSNHGDDRLLSVRGLRITTTGQAALAEMLQRPLARIAGAEPALSIEERRALRARFMEKLYATTEGDEQRRVAAEEICSALGVGEEEMLILVQYLAGERLLKYAGMGPMVSITHDGVREVEELLYRPERPTEHFPPYNQVIVYGNVSGTQLQVGVQGSTQVVQLQSDDKDAILTFVGEFRRILDEIVLQKGDRDAILADLDTVEAQLRSPSPKRRILRESLGSLRSVAENLIASGVWIGAAELINQLPF
jgi:enamine deaminase RidA (YjgF/YER057c/UK114 family)